jgi:hypothetical protein
MSSKTQLEFVHANPRQVGSWDSDGFSGCIPRLPIKRYYTQATREAESIVRMHDCGVSNENELSNSIRNNIRR